MSGVIWLVIIAVSLIVCGLIWYYSDEQKTKRAILSTPRVRLRDATEGAVAKVMGRVEYLTDPLTAPFSGRSCAYYLVTVQEYRSQGKSGSWVTIIRESDGVDFLINDGTGKARVVNQLLKVVAVKDATYNSGTFHDAPPHLEAFLNKHGQKSTGWLFNKSLRYEEAIFEAGERLAVVGQIRFEHDPGAVPEGSGYRETPRRAVIDAPPTGLILASDDPSVLRL
jgi:hypothetical protein